MTELDDILYKKTGISVNSNFVVFSDIVLFCDSVIFSGEKKNLNPSSFVNLLTTQKLSSFHFFVFSKSVVFSNFFFFQCLSMSFQRFNHFLERFPFVRPPPAVVSGGASKCDNLRESLEEGCHVPPSLSKVVSTISLPPSLSLSLSPSTPIHQRKLERY